MTEAYNTLCVEYFFGDPRRVRLLKPLRAYCDTLKREIEIPTGFICDLESVPVVKGTNNESGAWHDYFSRYDSEPVVDKLTCAKIYFEFQKYYDLQEGGVINTVWDFIRRWVKTGVVVLAPCYFHRLSVNAKYEEIIGMFLNVDAW
jgi:hypothetical protein